MFADFPLWAAALFTFLGILATAYFNYLTSKKTTTEQTNQTLISSVFTEIGRLQSRIDALESEREQLLLELSNIRAENAELRAENQILRQKIELLSAK